jgi:CheY-like chemotaxis protein
MPPPPPGPHAARRRPRADGERRVLSIDDNPVNQDLLARIAARHPGLRLQQASTGRQGLALAEADPPDLILLDIHLPDLDGYAVLDRLQALAGTCNVPVVALTADAMPADEKRGRRAGLAGYLTKPIDVGAVDAVFDRMWDALPDDQVP